MPRKKAYGSDYRCLAGLIEIATVLVTIFPFYSLMENCIR